MSKQFSVSGTPEEWQVLVNLINSAVKHEGLPAAAAGALWAQRIQKEVNDSIATKQTEVPPAPIPPSSKQDIPF